MSEFYYCSRFSIYPVGANFVWYNTELRRLTTHQKMLYLNFGHLII